MEYSSIQKYRTFGINEDDFLFDIFPSFRYTIYVTKREANVAGRAKPDIWLLETSLRYMTSHSSSTSDKIRNSSTHHPLNGSKVGEYIIIDRLGQHSLSSTFANCPFTATQSISTTFAFSHYSSKTINFTNIALPTISSCLAFLSNKPTVQDLLEFNKKFHNIYHLKYDENYALQLLIQILSFFESINAISFWFIEKDEDAGKSLDDERDIVTNRMIELIGNNNGLNVLKLYVEDQFIIDINLLNDINSKTFSSNSDLISAANDEDVVGSVLIHNETSILIPNDAKDIEYDNLVRKHADEYDKSLPTPQIKKVGGLNIVIERNKKQSDKRIKDIVDKSDVSKTCKTTSEYDKNESTSIPIINEKNSLENNENNLSSDKMLTIKAQLSEEFNAIIEKERNMRVMGFPEKIINDIITKDKNQHEAHSKAMLRKFNILELQMSTSSSSSDKSNESITKSVPPIILQNDNHLNENIDTDELLPIYKSRIEKMRQLGFSESSIAKVIGADKSRRKVMKKGHMTNDKSSTTDIIEANKSNINVSSSEIYVIKRNRDSIDNMIAKKKLRMKKMGFSNDIIDTAIGIEKKKLNITNE